MKAPLRARCVGQTVLTPCVRHGSTSSFDRLGRHRHCSDAVPRGSGGPDHDRCCTLRGWGGAIFFVAFPALLNAGAARGGLALSTAPLVKCWLLPFCESSL